MECTRRAFLHKSCQAASGLLLSGLVGTMAGGCSSGNPLASGGSTLSTLNASAVNNTITLSVDASAPLSTVGNAVLVQYQTGALLVAHTAQNVFTAVTALCTHQACTISGYNASSKQYVCPCHGSLFNTSGQVAQGPARRALTAYQTQFANDQLTITL